MLHAKLIRSKYFAVSMKNNLLVELEILIQAMNMREYCQMSTIIQINKMYVSNCGSVLAYCTT